VSFALAYELVGSAYIRLAGFGTRLRPLTLTLPKPLVEFCNKPMILVRCPSLARRVGSRSRDTQHQIEALVKAGVKDVVLAVNYRPEVMVALLSKLEEQYDIKITFSVESEPLGTGAYMA
jgi:mannose-1-phosphate guanylyltransferase